MVPGRGAVWISLGEARAEESLCVAECFVLWVRDRLAGGAISPCRVSWCGFGVWR